VFSRVFPLLVLAALLGGCGGGSSEGTTSTAERVRIGLVSDVGRFNDKSFNQSALEGLKRAEREFGADGHPVESRATSDYVPNLSSLARQHYDLTIAVGFLLAEPLHTVATRFPDEQFAIVDYSVHAPPFTANANVRGLTFATNENSYLVGCLAALMTEKQAGRQVISAVGGIKLPTVDIFIAGYRAGARACNTRIQILVGYSQDFSAQDKCKELALDQIARGSQVVFQVAGGCGLGALDAAKEKRKWGIGVDRDQSDLGPHILTSAVKRVDTAVYDTVEAVRAGTFKGGTDAVFDLENEGVALGKTSDQVPQSILDRIDDLQQQIIDGKISPPSTL
jgi:basic membrane protein A and related proteins